MAKLMCSMRKRVAEGMLAKFAYKNPMSIPELKKIVVSMGFAKRMKDRDVAQDCIRELSLITGQRPVVTLSRKAISGFKLREGSAVGVKVTLRREMMYNFLFRFIAFACPRILDFRGFRRRGDGEGNYSLGLPDQQMFPEIDLDLIKGDQGMNISFVTNANTDEEGLAILELLGFPFFKARRRAD